MSTLIWGYVWIRQCAEIGVYCLILPVQLNINDLLNSYNSNVTYYADDSTVICSEKNIHYLALKGNPELCNIENRINQNKLSLNYKKTNSKLFSKTSKNESAKFKVATYSRFIETSGVVKYLGVFVFFLIKN